MIKKAYLYVTNNKNYSLYNLQVKSKKAEMIRF